MPASNMGGSGAGNPSTGKFVTMDPMSGPKGSPLDKDQAGNFSTGALSTGIGFGASIVIGPVAPQSIKDKGFTDDYIPGVTTPGGGVSGVATMLYIGGGRSLKATNGIAATQPWSSSAIAGFGAGSSRDGGAGPAFTGFGMKMVTATAATPDGSPVEAGYVNRTGFPQGLPNGASTFGSAVAASSAPV